MDASSRGAPRDGGIDVSGSIGSSSGPLRYSLVVDDPPLFTAGALRAALQSAGITVDGAVKAGQDAGERREGRGVRVAAARRRSSREMNRESINIVAELLFRDAARASASDGIGTAETGQANLRDFLQKKVGRRSAVGQGVGRIGALDARLPDAARMIQLLGYAHQRPVVVGVPRVAARRGRIRAAASSHALARRRRETCTPRRERRTPSSRWAAT